MSKIRRGVWLMIAAVLLMAAFFLYWLTWNGSTKEIESIANELKVEPGWKLVTNQVVPDKTVCLDGNACPSVHRSWKTGRNLTRDDFLKLLHNTNWQFNIEGDCMPRSNVTASGGHTLCSASGLKNGYTIQVVVAGNYEDNNHGSVLLSIEK